MVLVFYFIIVIFFYHRNVNGAQVRKKMYTISNLMSSVHLEQVTILFFFLITEMHFEMTDSVRSVVSVAINFELMAKFTL